MAEESGKRRFGTRAVHAGVEPDPATGAIMTPVYLTSTFVQEAPGRHKGFEYSRSRHPTRLALEKSLAALEGGEYGLAFASGSAATAAVIQTLSAGDHVLCGREVYGGTYRLFRKAFARFGVAFDFVDALQPDAVAAALRPETKLLWLETPSNPLLSIADVEKLAALAHARGVRVAVDNTFATPCLQRPLELGADIAVHSTTKYLGGHSDVVGGAVVVDDPELYRKLRFAQNVFGAVPGPLDCYLVLRGIKTLELRMERHCANALRVAHHLLEHPEVEKVFYPGLLSHPGHLLAKKQMSGSGGMVAFELRGDPARALRLLERTELFALAESLGGVESLISYPATMSHGSVPRAERLGLGISDGLLRLSVGIEDAHDLVADLDQAIAKSREGG